MAFNVAQERVAMFVGLLEGLYGCKGPEEMDPVDLLVLTILSQNTSDTNSFPAFKRLKSVYPGYEQLLLASTNDIAGHIRSSGLADIKAARIKGAIEKIKVDAGAIDLGFIRDMELATARDYLESIPGIGPKTAAVVLLFGFSKPAMPVDTHVYRVSRRIGLVPENASIKQVSRILENITPVDKYLSFHINLINHGRRVCRARMPQCGQCIISKLCRYNQEGHGDAHEGPKELNDRKTTPHPRSGSVARPIMKDSHSFD